MKIALVYDRVNKFGGAERVLQTLHEIWPRAPLYTSVYDPLKASWSKTFSIKNSFLRLIPFSYVYHELLPVVTPLAFESFNFDNYDIVITLTSADAKGILTKPHTYHICYCLTPTRYLYSSYHDYLKHPGFTPFNSIVKACFRYFVKSLRQWDYIASKRPDKYIAISYDIASRIKRFYQKDVSVVYPPVDIKKFKYSALKAEGKYYLIVSRLVPYKNIDYVILTFNKLGWPLKIIGNGIDEKRLKNLAAKNIEFINGNLTDKKLCWYYKNCRALIFPGEEDFGISAVEAQACGKPVIALNKGGAKETVISGITGELYDLPDETHLETALYKNKGKKYLPSTCRKNALRFDKISFINQFKNIIEQSWFDWKNTL